MADRKRADQVGVGEEFESYTFHVTPEFNQQYLEAEEDYHPRYLQETEAGPAMVHPGLFINHSNVTRSPSFYLPYGMAAVHAKEEVEFCSPAYVGHTFEVHWLVAQTYEKRDKFYQVKFAYITDNMRLILWREITDVYIGREKQ